MQPIFAKPSLSKFKLLVLFFAVFPFVGIFFQNCSKLDATSTFDEVSSEDSESTNEEPAPPPDFDLLPHASAIVPGGSVQLAGSGPEATGLVYQLVAGDGTLTASGLYTAPATGARDVIVGAQNSQGVWAYSHIRIVTGTVAFAALPSAALVSAGSTFSFGRVGGIAPFTYSLSSTQYSSIDSKTGVLTAGDEDETLRVFVVDALGTVAVAEVQIDKDAALAMSAMISPSRLLKSQMANVVIGGGFGSPVLSLTSGNATLSGNKITAGASTSTLILRITDSGQQQLSFRFQVY